MNTLRYKKNVMTNTSRKGRRPGVKNGRATFLLLIAVLLAASYSHLTPRSTAQRVNGKPSPACGNDKCKVNELIINTGYDPITNTVLTPTTPATVMDPYWELVDAPSFVDNDANGYPDTPGSTTSLTMPSPSWVIVPNAAWKDLPLNSPPPQSGWISAYNVSASNLNNTNSTDPSIPSDPATYTYAPYAFQRCFCTCDGVKSIRIQFQMLVDNVAYVYFDGLQIDKQEDATSNAFQKPLNVDYTATAIKPGEHCLRIEVRNDSGEAMGLNVLGKITSDPPGAPLFLSPTCCKPTGKIIGRKIDDKNCNGKNDNNANNQSIEPGLQGWTIQATNTATGAVTTTTTDANGYYYFNNLAPGTYTISEQGQSNWSQTIPGTPGTYTVTLAVGQIIQRDFANCKKEGPPCMEAAIKEIRCKPGSPGSFTASLIVTNNSGSPVSTILLTPPGGGQITITPQQFNLAQPLQTGSLTTLPVTIAGATSDQQICINVTLLETESRLCACSRELCFKSPQCDCALFVKENVVLGANGIVTWTFTIANNTQFTINHIYVLGPISPAGAVVTPSYFPVSIPSGGQFQGTATITGATPGTTVCFDLGFYGSGLINCCASRRHCIPLPKGDITSR